MENIDLNKTRRFALAIGLVLFVYSIAGLSLDLDKTLTILGIPLMINNPKLIGIGLIICSIYATLRYLYYGIITGITPKKARDNLLNNRFPDGSRVSTEKSVSSSYLDHNTCKDRVQDYVSKYFPSFSASSKTSSEVFEEGQFYRFEIKTKPFLRVFGFIHGLDHWLPFWINIIAILAFLFYTLF